MNKPLDALDVLARIQQAAKRAAGRPVAVTIRPEVERVISEFWEVQGAMWTQHVSCHCGPLPCIVQEGLDCDFVVEVLCDA
jgi:hypothetical protein